MRRRSARPCDCSSRGCIRASRCLDCGGRGPKREPMTGSNGQLITPLFPLPNILLFPGCVVPLHIFEPRYRQMVGDLLDGPGRMVMGNLISQPDPFERCASAEKAAAQPPVYQVAGLGEIVHHEREPDGRFLIWLLGQSRVRIKEVSSERMYRLVDVEI